MTVVLMIVVLEFIEWYGEGKWLQDYLLEERNKFIAFVSFCLGLSSDRTASIIGKLCTGVAEFVEGAATRICQKLSSVVPKIESKPK